MSKPAPLLTLLLIVTVGISALLGQGALSPEVGGLIGLSVGVVWVTLASFLEKDQRGSAWNGVIGAVAGLFLGGISTVMIEAIVGGGAVWRGFALVAFPYAGFAAAGRISAQPAATAEASPDGTGTESGKILDTSAIIDGRIADVAQTGFLPGPYIVPQFVLRELQHIADSSDSLKRVRGRRGLDILQRFQKMPDIEIRIVDTDFPAIREVDSKLVALGKQMSAKVITNDFNLNKVARLQGVKVLNINELAGSLRSVVLPGESMNVFVSKDGKEAGQGVGYMEDGTMIVVDDGRRAIGRTVEVVVSTILQTPAGRMIFARLSEHREHSRESVEAHPVAPLVANPVVKSN